MNQAATAGDLKIILPSDQDASGRALGEEELALLGKVIEIGTLTKTKSSVVSAVERYFAELLGCRQTIARSSGTGAIHTAVASVEVIQAAYDSLTDGRWLPVESGSSGRPAALREISFRSS